MVNSQSKSQADALGHKLASRLKSVSYFAHATSKAKCLMLAALMLFGSGVSSSALALGVQPQISIDELSQWNSAPDDDDVLLPMPCGGYMAFRKVYTDNKSKMSDFAFEAGSFSSSDIIAQSPTHRYIKGAFLDTQGYYYLIGKYELTKQQYELLMAYQEGKGKCPTISTKVTERVAKAGLSWFDAVELARQYSLFLGSDNIKDLSILPDTGDSNTEIFVRLPTDSEWEFAARGGINVTEAEFREDTFPLNGKEIYDFAWYSGQGSAQDGKVRVVGLKQPNPLGLYDILGNVQEIVLEPFQATRTGRFHGQSGGMILRGGGIDNSFGEITTSARSERSYFAQGKENRSRDVGVRLVISSPVATSLAVTKKMTEELKSIGMDNEQYDLNTVATLDQIMQEQKRTLERMESERLKADVDLAKERKATQEARQALSKVQAEALEERELMLEKQAFLESANKELTASLDSLSTNLASLRSKMIEANTRRDEMRDRAIISSLRLGGYLCSAIASQQIAFEQNARSEAVIRNITLPACREDKNSKQCKTATEQQEAKLKQNRELARNMVDFYVSYYAEHLNDIITTFEVNNITKQVDSAQHALGAERSSLADYIKLFVKDVQDFKHSSRNLEDNQDKWIKQCRALKQ